MTGRAEEDPEATPGVGSSPAFTAVVELATRLAVVPRPLLIRGERGTGKELLARFVHQRSGRAAGRYVVLNCAAYPSELFDAAMFGHEKGAFTGAHERQPGKLELADGGTASAERRQRAHRRRPERPL
jgi:transcriptional regulator with PAS, ATPase and Fis domain